MGSGSCAYCGNAFEQQRRDQRFCSRQCAGRTGGGPRKHLGCQADGCERTDMAAHGLCYLHYKRKYQPEPKIVRDRTCEGCGMDFVQTGPGSDKRYCSRPCQPGRRVDKCAVRYGNCGTCDRLFITRGGRFCSDCQRVAVRDEKVARYRATRACPDCGGALAKNEQRCMSCAVVHNAATERRNRSAGAAVRRARLRAAMVEKFDPIEIFTRDGWVCQLCGVPVAKDAVVPHPDAPTLDHVVPLALGGEHSRANGQLAHFMCNSRKGARVEVVA